MRDSGIVTVYYNKVQNGGGFVSGWTGMNQSSPIAIHSGDINGDGFFDFAVASRLDNSVMWYRNEGNSGAFTAFVVTTTAMDARSVRIVDMNLDGLQDIVVVSVLDNKTAIHYGLRSDGTQWQEVQLNTSTASPVFVIAKDVTNEGYPDVFVGTASSLSGANNGLWWYASGAGGTSFTEQQMVQVADTRAIGLADVNSDGFLDVVFVSQAAHELAFVPNYCCHV